MGHIYLDHAATTPVDPRVAEAMLPYFTQHYGNPSSIHFFGREAKLAVETSRRTIASLLGVKAKEIIFTSGGTEADNLAIIGAALANRHRGNHLITSQAEHHAVLHAFHFLEEQGFEVTYLPVDQYGQVRPEEVENALRPETVLASFILVNNETGTLNPIEEIGRILKEREILFHTDGVQALGAIPLHLNRLTADLVSFSGHKIYGPKGIGCLYVRESVKLAPLLYGGAQERGRRAGTENVPAVVGFAEALKLAHQELKERKEHYERLRRHFLNQLTARGVKYVQNGHPERCLPHIVNLSFPGVKASSFLASLDLAGIAASSGSACTAGSLSPSHVIMAMHGDEERAQSAIRFSFGKDNTEEELDETAQRVAEIIGRMKGCSREAY